MLRTASGEHLLRVERARTFWSRFRGLMLRRALAADAALLLAGCASVHTAFMRFAIDVLYLDAGGVVLRCVPGLRPWRASVAAPGTGSASAPGAQPRAIHTVELAAGAIAALGIAPGDRLYHPRWFPAQPSQPSQSASATAPAAPRSHRRRERGAAVVELVVVGPMLTLLGLGAVQHSLLFYAKNQLDHAAFLAARAGSVGNARLAAIEQAYAEGLVPLFGGGDDAPKLAAALAAAKVSLKDRARIELLNPTRESFDDFNDPALQARLATGSRRVISNRGLSFKPAGVGPASGQTLQDANLIKLRITYGVKPAVPIIGSIYKVYLKWQDNGADAARTRMIFDGLVPVVSHVMLQMQSDAIEPDAPVSSPGPGNGGEPVDPGDPPPPSEPPPDEQCGMFGGCSTPSSPAVPGNTCPVPVVANMSTDTLFGFDQATLQPEGIRSLDQLLERTKGQAFDTLTVTGHSDPIGTEAYNLDLSRRRAQAVRDYLVAHGLKADHINVVGAGSSQPAVPPSGCAGMTGAALRSCYAPNRRVVVELKPKG